MQWRKKTKDRQRPTYTDRRGSKPFSYYKSTGAQRSDQRDQADLPRTSQRSRQSDKSDKQHISIWVGVLIAVVVGALYMMYVDTGSVQIVRESDSTLLKQDNAYQVSMRQILSSSISNRSKATIDTDAISLAFRTEHTELASAKVSFALTGHRLILRIAAETPRILLDDGSPTYKLVNKNGRVVASVDKTMFQQNDLPIILDRSNVSIEVGKAYLATEEIVFIERLVAQSKTAGLTISSITLPALAREVHVRFVEPSSIYVKFYTGGDADLQFGTFRAALSSIQGKGSLPSEYIDARVEGRVFTK